MQKNNKDAKNNKEAPENVSDVEGDLDIENDGELNRYNTQNMAEELCTPHVEHGVEGLYNKCDGWVLSSGRPNGPTIKELGHASPIKSSSPGIVCVHGYTVKESVAPILDEIFKKHGDIAAESIFTIPSMRSSFLEGICEVVRLLQSNDVKDKMEEVERYVWMAEQAKIDVSWLRVHLEAMQKTKEATEKSSLLVEMKINAILVKRAAQKDERQRCAELLAAQERFVEADRTVKVLHFVEKYLGDNLVKSEAEKNFLVRQPIL